jgi:hypothetical protein
LAARSHRPQRGPITMRIARHLCEPLRRRLCTVHRHRSSLCAGGADVGGGGGK